MSAWSTVNPRLQLAWDASSLKSYQRCPRHYFYNNVEGWEGESVHLSFGRYIASALERFQKARLDGLNREDAIIVAVRWALEETWTDDTHQWGGQYATMWKCDGLGKYKNEKGNKAICPYAFKAAWFPGQAPDQCPTCHSGILTERQYLPDDPKKNRESLIRAIIQYGLDQPEELADGLYPYTFPDGTAAVELSGRMPLPYSNRHGEQYLLTWNFDYIGVFGDETFIVDNKTTGKPLDAKYFDAWSPDTQFDTYSMVASVMFPDSHIAGVMVDAIQLLVGGVEFGRKPYYKTEAQHEEHLKDLGQWIADAEQSAETGYWRMNKQSCWLCPFKHVCSKDPDLREAHLQANFTKGVPWDPTHER